MPNDGDCFFSSIKAALPDGAAAGTEAARAGRALTVAEMREWVAEETGEEQLEFYILQAGAHPEDRWWVAPRRRFRCFHSSGSRFSFRSCVRECVFGLQVFSSSREPATNRHSRIEAWMRARACVRVRHARLFCLFLLCRGVPSRLDFVRPLDERIPSDDEEEDDDGKDDDSYKGDAESAASLSQSQSQSQSQRSRPKSPTSPRKSASGSRLSGAAKTRGRKKEDNGTSADGGSEGGGSKGGKGKGRRGKRGGGGGDEDAAIAATCTGDEDGVEDNGNVAVTAVPTLPASDRHSRRLRRHRNGGGGPSATAESPAAATNASKNEENAKSSSSQPATSAAAAAGTPSRKSARLGRGRQMEGDWRVGADSEGKGAGTGGATGEKGNNGKEDQDEGLPFVQTVEDLRRFVRLEGSVVGHGNCMWADTFAHHVVSRRLKITILFVDMVSGAG